MFSEFEDAPIVKECGLCLNVHSSKECPLLKDPIIVNDNVPVCKAYATLPKELSIERTCDGQHNVKTNKHLKIGTRFGPLDTVAEEIMTTDIPFIIKILTEEEKFLYLNTGDENVCNWMCLVEAANSFDECNLVAYQKEFSIYFSVVKEIQEKEELKVYYAPVYAFTIGAKFLKSSLDDLLDDSDKQSDLEADEPMISLDNVDNFQMSPGQSGGDMGEPIKELERDKLKTFPAKSLGVVQEESEWICAICSDVYETIPGFALHLREHYDPKNKNLILKKERLSSMIIPSNTPETIFSVPGLAIGPNNTYSVSLTLGDELQVVQSSGSTNIVQTAPTLFFGSAFEANNKTKTPTSLTEDLRCPICNKKFSTRRNLFHHLKKHTGEFHCDKCKKVFARKENLQFHECLDLNYVCEVCNKQFNRVIAYRNHCKTHIERSKYSLESLRCPYCLHESKSLVEYTRHVKGHYSPDLLEVSCPICDKEFKRPKVFFTSHLSQHEKEFLCGVCHKIFVKQSLYDKHRCVNRIVEESCSPAKLRRSRKLPQLETNCEDKKENIGDRLICDLCFETFPEEKFLAHKKTHKKDNDNILYNSFLCSDCGESYGSKTALEKHFAYKHSDLHPCPRKNCRHTFVTKEELMCHLQDHEDSNQAPSDNFPCAYCFKTFKKSRYRLIHVKGVHLQDRPFACALCTFKCKLKTSLISHIKHCHSSKPQSLSSTTFNCNKCKCKFKSKKTLENHLQTHEVNVSYSCKFCDKRTVRRKVMIKHLTSQHNDFRHIWNSESYLQSLLIGKDQTHDSNLQRYNLLEKEAETERLFSEIERLTSDALDVDSRSSTHEQSIPQDLSISDNSMDSTVDLLTLFA